MFNVSGWGALSSDGGSPDKLNVVTVPFISASDCQAKYDNPPPGYSPAQITEQMICAGNVEDEGIPQVSVKFADINHLLFSSCLQS